MCARRWARCGAGRIGRPPGVHRAQHPGRHGGRRKVSRATPGVLSTCGNPAVPQIVPLTRTHYGSYECVYELGADTLGTDTLKEGFVFESTAGPPLRTSISPRTVVGALVVALLKIVTTIRFHGELS